MFWFKKENPEEKLKRKYQEKVKFKILIQKEQLTDILNDNIENCKKSFLFYPDFEEEFKQECKNLGVKCELYIPERINLFPPERITYKVHGWADVVEEEPKLTEITLGSSLKISGTELSIHEINKIRNERQEEELND